MTTNQDTVKAYDATAAEYAAEAAITPLWVAQEMDAFVTRLHGAGRGRGRSAAAAGAMRSSSKSAA